MPRGTGTLELAQDLFALVLVDLHVRALKVGTNHFPFMAKTGATLLGQSEEITNRRLYHVAVQKFFTKLTAKRAATPNISHD